MDGDIIILPRNKKLKSVSRKLRSSATVYEDKLWYYFLKNMTPGFTRQRIIGNYIVDFYCHKASLVIEVDGAQHNRPEAIEYDRARTEYLNSLGINVLRFSNNEVEENMALVCATIKEAIKTTSTQ